MTADRSDESWARARALLAERASSGGVVSVVYHADADGISAAALACDGVELLGGVAVGLTPPKGKNVYDPSFRARLAGQRARLVLVLDTGSRAGTIWRDAPTVVVDHHVASSPPTAAAFVHDEDAISTSTLLFELIEPIAPAGERAWLAAVGALGDRGDAARQVPCVAAAIARFGVSALRDVVALVNASGRASEPAPEVALAALRAAREPRDVVRGMGEDAVRLRAMRAEVAAASTRARRAPQRVRGRWAIIEIAEPCRVHGVVASAWARRLAPKIVLVANRGYVEGRVHVSVRSHEPIDLRAAMRDLLPDEGGDYAAGHARATGAIVDVPTYERVLAAIESEARAAPAA